LSSARGCKGRQIFTLQFTDRSNPIEKHVPVLATKYGISAAPMMPQMFGAAGKQHMEKYGEGFGP
jgi:sterol carrier protein 2